MSVDQEEGTGQMSVDHNTTLINTVTIEDVALPIFDLSLFILNHLNYSCGELF